MPPSAADPDLWALACDISIEAAISAQCSELALPDDCERKSFIRQIENHVPLLTTPEVFKSLSHSYADLLTLRNLFTFDEHLWILPPDQASNNSMNDDQNSQKEDQNSQKEDQNSQNEDPNLQNENQNPQNENQNPQNEDQNPQNGDQNSQNEAQNPQNGNQNSQSIAQNMQNDAQNMHSSKANEWKEAARKILVDLESFSGRGNERGLMEKNIGYLTRDEMDYSDFLQQFAVLEEKMMLDPDEFDYVYYTYGLRLPGKRKLLIEPLEYREVKQIREFAIAIDTSGSTDGALVKKFLRKTYSILKSTEMFTSSVNIHIIQCDTDIQEDIAIHSLDDIDEYTKDFKIKGLGGTDFRPVFRYIETLRSNGEFNHLCGLIYFTDGMGIYPNQPTDYKTAFVFLDKYDERSVPPWALRSYWKEDET